MNKSQSKYFNTAKKMDEALLYLLDKKEFEFITVKELCKVAGVNRSTFYLHYTTLDDLIEETNEYIFSQFAEYYKNERKIASDLNNLSLEELFFITPQYLKPYLLFIKENKKLFKTVLKRNKTFNTTKSFLTMFELFFNPIMAKYGILEEDRKYVILFYVRGIIAIIEEWLIEDAKKDIDEIVKIIINCVNHKTI